jgi:Matrixin
MRVPVTYSYSMNARRWPTGRCEVNLSGPTWPLEWQPVALSAMGAWNAVGARFSFVEDSRSQNSLACYEMGSWGGRLAFTWTRPPAAGEVLVEAQTMVNAFYNWDPAHPTQPPRDVSKTFNLGTMLRHEFGHFAGLGDQQQNPDSVMYSAMRGSVPGDPPKQVTQDDRNGLFALYS